MVCTLMQSSCYQKPTPCWRDSFPPKTFSKRTRMFAAHGAAPSDKLLRRIGGIRFAVRLDKFPKYTTGLKRSSIQKSDGAGCLAEQHSAIRRSMMATAVSATQM